MTVEAVIFFFAAALALGGAVGVVLGRNPVHCALLLVVTLVAVAIFFLLQDAQLVAVVQIIVYAGAIVVLFLFVIMLLGVDKEESLRDPIPYQRPAAVALGAILLAEIFVLAGRTWATGAKSVRGSVHQRVDGQDLGNVQRVARILFTDFLWAFELTAVLLVIAVVGAVVLARRSGQRAQLDEHERDAVHGIEKFNPLAAWRDPEVWHYLGEHSVPYNRLYDQGYRSIGCAPCTRPVQPGEDIRAGRWWWEQPETKECGLHVAPKENGDRPHFPRSSAML